MYKGLPDPLEATPLAAATVEQASAFAKPGDRRLAFLYVSGALALSGEGALLHATSPAAFADGATGNPRDLLDMVGHH